jgi:hypothetical protein
MKQKLFQHFSSRPPSAILHDLLDLKCRKEKGEPIELPLITLMLNNKSVVSGNLIDYKKQSAAASYVAVKMVGTYDVFFAETTGVQGLIVHDMEKIEYLLYDLTDDLILPKNPVTRYEVKKRVDEEAQRLYTFFGKPIRIFLADEQLGTLEYFHIRNLVSDIAMGIIAVAESEGKEKKLTPSFTSIEIKKSDSLVIARKGNTLVVADTLLRSYTTAAKRNKLVEALAGYFRFSLTFPEQVLESKL